MGIRVAVCAALFSMASIPGWAAPTAERVGVVDEASAEGGAPFDGVRPTVDVAILLDTSNSMDGLIKQAKSQIWTIVQQFAEAKKDGMTPSLRVALFEYGNTNLPASEGYLRQVVPLSDDLDRLSEALFALTTNGGDEYCGQVIQEALARLDWSDAEGGYKAIFIAGNEPFTQGPVDFREVCPKAIGAGVVVNTIHCGDAAQGVAGKWREAAEIAEGEAFNIDQDRKIVQIPCPQDPLILKLNVELNGTYLWYGATEQRNAYGRNQAVQDSNAASLGQSTAISRARAKTGAAYSNVGRCLVDTYLDDQTILSKVKPQQLPQELQSMSADELAAHVQKLADRRQELKKEIGRLTTEREAYLAEERRRRAADSGDEATLGDAVVNAVQSQLNAAGFSTE